jgi:hypothetical protein
LFITEVNLHSQKLAEIVSQLGTARQVQALNEVRVRLSQRHENTAMLGLLLMPQPSQQQQRTRHHKRSKGHDESRGEAAGMWQEDIHAAPSIFCANAQGRGRDVIGIQAFFPIKVR